jgi:hypothetical protein
MRNDEIVPVASSDRYLESLRQSGGLMNAARPLFALGLLLSMPGLVNAQAMPAPGGTYSTAVVLEENNCQDAAVRDGPTEISPDSGSDSVTIRHAGQSYRGSLTRAGEFTTVPRTLEFDGTSYTIAIKGKVETGGFVARVAVDVRKPSTNLSCRYTVKWTGTREP